jgi:ABC-type antimicrobial peptide transport system permease subunit
MASSDDFPISFSPRVVVTRSAILFTLALVAAVPAIRRVLRIDPVLATVPAGVDG